MTGIFLAAEACYVKIRPFCLEIDLMEIDRLVLGDFETNCYVLRAAEDSKECLIIDTGLQADYLVEFLEAEKLSPVVVVFTHGHADHISGVKALWEKWPDIKTVIHKDDAKMLTSCVKNISMLTDEPFTTDPADIVIEDEDRIEFAGLDFQVFHTPGHTQGGMCLYNADESAVFVGDTMFAGSIGRTDLPGGSFDQLINSIKTKLLTLKDDTKVYAGHGPVTTIGVERQSNPYLIH